MSHSITRIAQATLLIATVATSSVALAGDHGKDGKKGRRGPPPQAFEACEGLQKGTVCEVQTRRGNLLTGECVVPRRKLRQRLNAEAGADANAPIDAPAQAQTDEQTDARPVITEDTLVCRPDRHKRRQQSKLL